MNRGIFAFGWVAAMAMTMMVHGATSIRATEKGPLHEAFVTPVTEDYVLQAIPSAPPAPVQERVEQNTRSGEIFIPGYWNYDENTGDFIWVSGVFRVPPPGHQWISGYWKEFEEGYVRIPGFWSTNSLDKITYLPSPPPSQVNEDVAYPSQKDLFFAPGYWGYSAQSRSYVWHPGHWEQLNTEYVFVPARYIWSPDGYIFVAAHWDLPLAKRGRAFVNLRIPEAKDRGTLTFEPSVVLDEPAILHKLMLRYPDYVTLLQHHYHFNNAYWSNVCCVPYWWKWQTWWTLTWHDHWALYWWHTHPGYPQPHWVDEDVAALIPPASAEAMGILRDLHGPSIVLTNGVVEPGIILGAVIQVTGNNKPILPRDRALIRKAHFTANSKAVDVRRVIKPSGHVARMDAGQKVRKPRIDSVVSADVPTGRAAKVPNRPTRFRSAPEVREQKQAPEFGTNVRNPSRVSAKQRSRWSGATQVSEARAPKRRSTKQNRLQQQYPKVFSENESRNRNSVGDAPSRQATHNRVKELSGNQEAIQGKLNKFRSTSGSANVNLFGEQRAKQSHSVKSEYRNEVHEKLSSPSKRRVSARFGRIRGGEARETSEEGYDFTSQEEEQQPSEPSRIKRFNRLKG